ncbi:exopolyphosphatase [Escherichia coli HVH 91 (4-4638751)]|nr:exopolyphosphatase [Escherichia coli HVH 91 (4-4638751)]
MPIHDKSPRPQEFAAVDLGSNSFHMVIARVVDGAMQIIGRLKQRVHLAGNDSNLLIVFYVQIMPDDFVMQLHRF